MKTMPLVFFPNSASAPERLRQSRPHAISIPDNSRCLSLAEQIVLLQAEGRFRLEYQR